MTWNIAGIAQRSYRRKAEGRRQKAEGIKYIFALCHKGLKPLNLFMKKIKRFFFEIRSTRKKGVLT
jgi:hypothetical protein